MEQNIATAQFPSPAQTGTNHVWYPVLCIWAAGRFTARTGRSLPIIYWKERQRLGHL